IDARAPAVARRGGQLARDHDVAGAREARLGLLHQRGVAQDAAVVRAERDLALALDQEPELSVQLGADEERACAQDALDLLGLDHAIALGDLALVVAQALVERLVAQAAHAGLLSVRVGLEALRPLHWPASSSLAVTA